MSVLILFTRGHCSKFVFLKMIFWYFCFLPFELPMRYNGLNTKPLQCEEKYGVFVRPTQIQLLDGEDNPMDTSISTPSEETKAPSRRLSRYMLWSFIQKILFWRLLALCYKCVTQYEKSWYILKKIVVK